MNMSKVSPRLIIALLITIIFAISLIFRVVIPYEQVFNGEWVKYTSVDAYFHMRLVDNIVYNFPFLMDFDPYFCYPGGELISNTYFPDWLLAGIIWIIGLGSPTQNTVDIISVLFPALIAALTIIPVYFIGKTLFNRWVGVLAAGLMAVLPGEYLGRTILGLNDTPGIETLLSTTFLAFIIAAVKTARERGLTLGHILQFDRTKCVRPLVLSALAGLFLGMYLISWSGALLFVFIFILYAIIQAIKDHLESRSIDYLGIIGAITLLIALIIYFPIASSSLYIIALVLAFFIPVVLAAIARAMTLNNIKSFYFPIALVAAGGIAVAIFYGIKPDLLKSMLSRFDIFAPAGATAATTIEMQPFLAPTGSFTTQVAWGNFTTNFFLLSQWAVPGVALISLSILIYLFIRKHDTPTNYVRPVIWTVSILVTVMIMLLMSGYGHRYWALTFAAVLIALLFIPGDRDKHRLPFLVWSVVILALTLGQRRFAYYLVVNIALLSAYLSWQIVWLAGARKLAARPGEAPAMPEGKQKDKKKAGRRERRGVSIHVISASVAFIAVFFLVFFPNIVKATEMTTTEEAPYSPTDAWMASMLWMKDNTPEPMGDPDAYYRRYDPPPPGESFPYPESAYGVTSWWDYGYWITRIAHRIPNANPGQDPARIYNVASLFVSQDDETARELLGKMGTSYIIIDYQTVTSKHWAVITWSGQPQQKFVRVFAVRYEGTLQAVQFYLPEYYQTLAVRLYNFDGKAVTKVKPAVITYVERKGDGITYNEVTDAREFDSYEEALDYVNSQETGNHIIAGISPFVSPVPLEAVPDFQLVHSSEQGTSIKQAGFMPEVKIFEYTGQNK
jgi:oligosaccharyl transferase (archaeosortase A-associated)